MNSASKNRLKYILFFILGIAIAIWPALYNNFPLVTPDSGAYIGNGIKLSLPIDRPITYSLFILLTSWGISLWYVVVVQGALFVLLLQRICMKLLHLKPLSPLILGIIFLVSFGTQAAWFTAQLVPDIFTSFLLLSILLFFLEDKGNKRLHKLWLVFIAVFMLAHYSNILILILLVICLFFYFRITKLKKYFSKLKALTVIAVGGYLLISSVNLIAGRGFTLSPAAHVFIMGRLAENGILDAYLKEKCPVTSYKLCNFQGHLGDRQWEFMWMGDYPHNQRGWLDPEVKKEYRSIIIGTLTTPKFLGLQIVKAGDATFRQLAQLYVGDGLQQLGEGSSPYKNIDKFFPYQIKEYRTSLQVLGQLPTQIFDVVILITNIILFLAFLLLAEIHQKDFCLLVRQQEINWQLLFVISILFLVINAFVSANFSTVIARLQARVFWVLPLLVLIYCLHLILPKMKIFEMPNH